MDFIQENLQWILLVGGFFIVYIIAMFVYTRQRRRKQEQFEVENPETARVFIKANASESFVISAIDEEPPIYFYKGTKRGFYLNSGAHVLTLSYSHTRPGVVHRSVTQSFAESKVEIKVESRKDYELSFNRKESRYVFKAMIQD